MSDASCQAIVKFHDARCACAQKNPLPEQFPAADEDWIGSLWGGGGPVLIFASGSDGSSFVGAHAFASSRVRS